MAQVTRKRRKYSRKKKKEDRLNKILVIIGIITLVTAIVLLLSLSYAFFSHRVDDKNPDIDNAYIVSANLLVKYQDGKSNIELGSKIVPGEIITKEFIVKNDDTANDTGMFAIVLDNYINQFDRLCDEENTSSDLYFSLVRTDSNGIDIITEVTGNLPCSTSTSKLVLDAEESVLINEINYYKLTIEYRNLEDVNQSDDMGSLFEARINITESENERRTAPISAK